MTRNEKENIEVTLAITALNALTNVQAEIDRVKLVAGICVESDCLNKVSEKGNEYCNYHYQKWMKEKRQEVMHPDEPR